LYGPFPAVPGGLVDAEEFRSNLFPWTALAERGDLGSVHGFSNRDDPARVVEGVEA
jgi:hypothetical protein